MTETCIDDADIARGTIGRGVAYSWIGNVCSAAEALPRLGYLET
jgi:hypothetical protein